MLGMNVYLDIDGLLLANDYNAANHVHEFLQLVISRYPNSTYWLTTHCKGDPTTAVERLRRVFEPKTMKLIYDIKPTNWEVAKTEAIDFSQPFLWFDDDLYDDERQALIEHGVLDNWIGVDLAKDPDQLLKFVTSLPLPVQAI
jgi:hypothetical protein